MQKHITLLLLGILVFSIHPVSANDNWSDDFSSDLSNWDIAFGNYTVVNGVLVANDPSTEVDSIWRNSTQGVGTWSIKVLRNDTSITPFIYPIALDKKGYSGEVPVEGIIIAYDYDKVIDGNDLDPNRATISLVTRNKPLRLDVLGQYSAPDQLLDWNTLKLERNNLDEFRLYMNDELIIGPIVSQSFKTSEYFHINTQAGAQFDDISYTTDYVNATASQTNQRSQKSYGSSKSPYPVLTVLTLPPILDIISRKRRNISEKQFSL